MTIKQLEIATSPDGNSAPPLPLPPDTQVATLELHPVPEQEGLIIKVKPPREPLGPDLHPVPCDIVLVIDISGSMGEAAKPPKPAGQESRPADEDPGLSVLDLVKHAARTIVEVLGPEDRLGIVTFSTNAKIVQGLTFMDDARKHDTKNKLARLREGGMTNLWQGLIQAQRVFSGSNGAGRASAIMILTDGQPNVGTPTKGICNSLKDRLREWKTERPAFPATVHTFGFGYDVDLKSGLLKTMAELGDGNYGFIPDSGMIGTVFVHAVANLQSTFAKHASLKLEYPAYIKIDDAVTSYDVTATGQNGSKADKGEKTSCATPMTEDSTMDDDDFTDVGSLAASTFTEVIEFKTLTLPLGNIQYTQSRDIFIPYLNAAELRSGFIDDKTAPALLKCTLSYTAVTRPTELSVAEHTSISHPCTLSKAEVAYHISRTKLFTFLLSLFPINHEGERAATLNQSSYRAKTALDRVISLIPAAEFPDDAANQSLLADLNGQVRMAIEHPKYWIDWGRHFLPSLAGAHARQICMTFKDPGPLRYAADSPLFCACRDRLDRTFSDLPAPEPSRRPAERDVAYRGAAGHGQQQWQNPLPCRTQMRVPIHMSAWNNAANGCFAAHSTVELAGGAGKKLRIGRLRRGMGVRTPRGDRRVVAVLRLPVRAARLCLVGGLLVTPWHPVRVDGEGAGWVFPAEVATKTVRYTGAVYTLLLERDEDVDAHAVMVNGVWGVTLGHGLLNDAAATGEQSDVRAHDFFGNYDLVARSLARLSGVKGRSGVVLSGGLLRDGETGLVRGFRRQTEGKKVNMTVRRTAGRGVRGLKARKRVAASLAKMCRI